MYESPVKECTFSVIPSILLKLETVQKEHSCTGDVQKFISRHSIITKK